MNVEASRFSGLSQAKNAATADLASANAYASVDHNGVVTGKRLVTQLSWQFIKVRRSNENFILLVKENCIRCRTSVRGDSRKEPEDLVLL